MLSLCYFTLLISLGAVACSSFDYNATLEAPRPVRDRFRIIQTNIAEEKLSDEISDFTAYGCEKMVVIRNKALKEFKISCRSHHDSPKQAVIQPGNAYSFSFRPQKNGDSKFWCTVEYNQQYARFDVYNEDLPYMCPRDIDEVYQYVVRDEGVFIDKTKGSEGQKIGALMKGDSRFILWEEFEEGETDGFLVHGSVDGGMCYNIPEQFNDRTAAVTICHNHCVRLYEHYGCQGKMQLVQANDECHNAGLSEELGNKLSAIQGCYISNLS